jgi:flagellar basal-body rod protein FlgC
VTFQSSQRDSQAAPGGQAVEARVEVDTQTPFRIVHQPGHPQADAEGNVRFPNVNVITEFVNAVEASRAYEANLSAMEITKTMIQGAFKILG